MRVKKNTCRRRKTKRDRGDARTRRRLRGGMDSSNWYFVSNNQVALKPQIQGQRYGIAINSNGKTLLTPIDSVESWQDPYFSKGVSDTASRGFRPVNHTIERSDLKDAKNAVKSATKEKKRLHLIALQSQDTADSAREEADRLMNIAEDARREADDLMSIAMNADVAAKDASTKAEYASEQVALAIESVKQKKSYLQQLTNEFYDLGESNY